MSIHEVHYDDQGRIIWAKCVDKEIDDHRKNLQPNPPDLDEIETTASGFAGLPAKFHTLTAVNKSTVIESFTELRTDRVVRLAPAIIHRREDIANARVNIRGREYGFVWTEPGQQVEIYVAPTPTSRPGFKARLRTALGR